MIDYVKENEDDLWQATNIQTLNTKGAEINMLWQPSFAGIEHKFDIGYAYLREDLQDLDINFSRYSINSLKHQVSAVYRSTWLKNISHTLVYKFAERTNGSSYTVVDGMISYRVKSLTFDVVANNIFNAEYTETNLVPMPKGNVLFGLTYIL